MQIRKLTNLTTIIGVFLAWAGFVIGAWLGGQSGIALLFDIAAFLRRADPQMETARQRSILLMLAVVALALAAMLMLLILQERQERRGRGRLFLVAAVVAVAALLALVVRFNATASGVLVTLLGALLALGGQAGTLLLGRAGASPAHDEEAPFTEPAEPQDTGPHHVDPVDSMVEFQEQVSRSFHTCRRDGSPFCLALMGIPTYEEYVAVFGARTADQAIQRLEEIVRREHPTAATAVFSIGVVMAAFPRLEKSQAADLLRRAGDETSATGLAGEMLLADQQSYWCSHIAAYPHDGQTLSQLTEAVLLGYSTHVDTPTPTQ